MKDFADKLAVITGAGSGMGRELAKQLAAQGGHVAFCDVSAENMAETKRACEELAPAGTTISSHACDVSDERQVIAFRDAVRAAHSTERIHLLFNNAGIGGGGSFLKDERAEWDRTFAVCWGGVYNCARAFMPMLVAADEACIVNTSSLNGFWACLGPTVPHTAYSTAKFAVKGFSEGLVVDLKVNAPHVKVALVMPGHIGTDIALNSRKVLGKPDPTQMDAEEVAAIRKQAARQGMPVEGLSDDQLRGFVAQRMADFRDKAPLSAAAAATIILDGVREERFRLLVGEDAKLIDQRVREVPDLAYDPGFFAGFGAAARGRPG
jgi:NAD(P)-dependent dehydrogenase (short-subunit alcohol dehydrogenase family)